jgi:hypothetical protein
MAKAELTTSTARRAGRADLLAHVDAMVRREILSPDSRSHALLLYLVDHYLTQGPGEPVKAYAIAVDVLGRGAAFDPAQDSIVRVEIGRLRKLLDMYAQGPGQDDPLRLSLPRGQSHLAVALQDAAPPRAAPGRAMPAEQRHGSAVRVAGAVLAVVLAVVLAAGLIWALRSPDRGDDVARLLDADYPRVFVRPLAKDGPTDAAYPESALARFLADALSGWRSFRVIAPQPPTSLPVRPRDYVLDGTAAVAPGQDADGLALSLRLRDGTGAVLWTDRIVLDATGPDPARKVYAALTEAAGTLGGALGVIDADGRARMADEGQAWTAADGSAFRCFLRWQSFDLTKDPQEGEAARRCLEALAAADTPVGQIWAALGLLRFLDWSTTGAGIDDPRLAAALAAANRAVLIDPAGADGHEALGAILTGMGQTAEARAVLERAMQLNASNPDTLIKIGWLDALEGDWTTGRDRILAVASSHAAVPGWYRLPLALDALRQGDTAALRTEAAQMVAAGDRRGLVLLLAAARLDGDDTAAAEAALAAAGLTPQAALAEIAAVFPAPVVTDTLRAAIQP